MCWDRLIEAETAASNPESRVQEVETPSEVDRILASLYQAELEEAQSP